MRNSWEDAYQRLKFAPGYGIAHGTCSMSAEQAAHHGSSLLALPRETLEAGIKRPFETMVSTAACHMSSTRFSTCPHVLILSHPLTLSRSALKHLSHIQDFQGKAVSQTPYDAQGKAGDLVTLHGGTPCATLMATLMATPWPRHTPAHARMSCTHARHIQHVHVLCQPLCHSVLCQPTGTAHQKSRARWYN